MINKIALEEHFAIPEYNEVRPSFISTQSWREVQRRITDFTEDRLPGMDATGIEYAVVSLTSPGIQGESDAAQASERARRSNDVLADAIAAHPDRLGGFAAVALQDVDAAISELHRAVADLGFHGVLVNSWTDLPGGGVGRLDDPRFDAFWGSVADLDVPLYLHPRLLPAGERGAVSDRPELAGPVWEFTTDTSASALRLITSGLFDRHPQLRVILGHLGESLPYNIWRIENRMLKAYDRVHLDHPLSSYLTRNFWVTTSGHFYAPSLMTALAAMGESHVMFSVDYPYDEMDQGAAWFDSLDLPLDVHRSVGRNNAATLLRLGSTGGADANA